MDDDVARIQKNPIAAAFAFKFGGATKVLLDLVLQLFRDRNDLTRGAARADQHVIANRRFTAQIDLHDVFSFVFLEGIHDKSQQRIAAGVIWASHRGGPLISGRCRIGVNRQDTVLHKHTDSAPVLGFHYVALVVGNLKLCRCSILRGSVAGFEMKNIRQKSQRNDDYVGLGRSRSRGSGACFESSVLL